MASRKSTHKAASSRRAPAGKKRRTVRVSKWSGAVTKGSNALDLQPGIFKSQSARRIAQSLKRSAEASRRRKASPFQSAMSMLNFEINRAGRGLSATRRQVLNRAKIELRKAYGRA
jgi:hypothetical protein